MASCENCYNAFEAGYEEAELAYINADRAKIVADAHQMTQDLQRIAQELGIGARPYSGHEAMERDILPEIRRLRQVEAVYESIVTRMATIWPSSRPTNWMHGNAGWHSFPTAHGGGLPTLPSTHGS